MVKDEFDNLIRDISTFATKESLTSLIKDVGNVLQQNYDERYGYGDDDGVGMENILYLFKECKKEIK